MATTLIDRLLYTYAETGRRLALSGRTIWQLVHDGTLRPVRVGRSVRISRAEIERFIQQRTVDAGGEDR